MLRHPENVNASRRAFGQIFRICSNKKSACFAFAADPQGLGPISESVRKYARISINIRRTICK